MRRRIFPSFLVLVLTLLLVSGGFAADATVRAQTPPSATATATATPAPETGDEELGIGLFPWAFEDGGFSGNYLRGLVLYLLGTVGALIAVYSTLGDFLPSMGRGAYDLQKAEVDELRQARDDVLRQRKAFADRGEDPPADLGALSDDYVALVAAGDQSLARLRWRLIAMAVPLYVLLGGFVAAQLQRETSSTRTELDAVIDENERLTGELDAAAARYNELADRYQEARRQLRNLAVASEDAGEADDGGDGSARSDP